MSMSERMETQISGKYSKEESRLFDFKKSMEQAGIHVNFPVGDEVIEDEQDFAITHETERDQSFHKTEVDFLRSVKESPVHVVFNIFKENEGFIGESASIEIAYALAHNKPMVLLRNPIFSETVPDAIKDIIIEKASKLNVAHLDSQSIEEIERYINNVSVRSVDYELTDEQKIICMRYIRGLLKLKRKDWQSKNKRGI